MLRFLAVNFVFHLGICLKDAAIRSVSSKASDLQQRIVSLCRHRGFVFPGSDLYGGLANSYDYGPLGTQMKKNIQDTWWRKFVVSRTDCIGLDSSVILHPQVWEASGHIENFTDPMTVCSSCNSRVRADKLVEESADCPIQDAGGLSLEELHDTIQKYSIKCPTCKEDSLQKPKKFNLLFKTAAGSTEETSDTVYLRPETAQGAYINFQLAQSTSRRSLPLGLGQIGKSFRNEISPGNFLFRTREFEQMELQYFCHPSKSGEAYREWIDYCYKFLCEYGIQSSKLRKREHSDEELAHYATATTDIEYEFPFGWGEMWGIANRGSYDLEKHMTGSKSKFAIYTDPVTKEKYLPHVIEPAVGTARVMLAMLIDAYHVEVVDGRERTVLRLHPDIAPYKFAVLPLSKKPHLMEMARKLYGDLTKHACVDFDAAGSIGRRYRRQDEIGTPMCLTIDFDSVEDNCVTLRARDSMKQMRLSVDELLSGNYDFNKLNELE